MNRAKWNHLIGIGLCNLATLAWASNMVLGRVLKDEIGPVTLSAARFIIAAGIFMLLLRRQPPEDRRMGKDLWLLIGMAVTGVILFSPVLYLGLHYTSAVNSTIINGLGPLLTGAMAAVLIHQPMSRRQVVGAIIGLAGVLYLISGGSLSFWETAQFNKGDIIILIAVAFWGLYSLIGGRVMRHRSAISTTAFSTLLGLPVLCLFSGWELQNIPVVLDVKMILALLYLGVIPAAGGFYAWNAGIARLGASGAMVFYNTLPLYGALLGVMLIGEPIEAPHIIGGLLIIMGGIWAAWRPAPQPKLGILAEERSN